MPFRVFGRHSIKIGTIVTACNPSGKFFKVFLTSIFSFKYINDVIRVILISMDCIRTSLEEDITVHLNNYLNLNVCRPFVIPCVQNQASVPTVFSQNITHKSCLVHTYIISENMHLNQTLGVSTYLRRSESDLCA